MTSASPTHATAVAAAIAHPTLTFGSGFMCTVAELAARADLRRRGASVAVVGRVAAYDALAQTMRLEDPNDDARLAECAGTAAGAGAGARSAVTVSLRNLREQFFGRDDALVMVLGVVVDGDAGAAVRARVGLALGDGDYELFVTELAERRAWMSETLGMER